MRKNKETKRQKKKSDKARYLSNRYPEKNIVLGDCNHDGRKHKHHIDYNEPFEVFNMCGSCHLTEHGIINTCERLESYDLVPDEEMQVFLLRKIGFTEEEIKEFVR